jgi:hypothetical protein
MDKLRKASKRLNVGSWGPFSSGEDKRASWTPSMASAKRSGDFIDSSELPASVPAPTAPTSHPVTVNGAANGTAKAVANGTSASTMVELAKIITRESEKLEKYLKESGSPMPSFDINGPANFPSLPDDMKKSRLALLKATQDLEYLVTGPTEKVRWMAWDVSFH